MRGQLAGTRWRTSRREPALQQFTACALSDVEPRDLRADERAIRTEREAIGDRAVAEDPGELVLAVEERGQGDATGEPRGLLQIRVGGDGDEAGATCRPLVPEALPDRQLFATASPGRPDEDDERVAQMIAQPLRTTVQAGELDVERRMPRHQLIVHSFQDLDGTLLLWLFLPDGLLAVAAATAAALSRLRDGELCRAGH